MFEKDNNRFALLTVLALLISFIAGALAFFLVEKKVPVSADKILDQIKNQFKDEGPIEGSWIEMTQVPWKKYSYGTRVYYGGISRYEEGKIVQYEFVADAYSGTLMDIYKI